MSIAYIDCFSGIAGDMFLGGLIDLGLPLRHLESELKKLSFKGYRLSARKGSRQGIGGVDFKVHCRNGHHHHTPYKKIAAAIRKSALSAAVKKTSLEIFEKIGRAEAKIHRTSLDKVEFHEVGALDSIIDIVGAAIGLDYFRFEKIYASPIPLGSGQLRAAHGILPIPAPATLEIIKGLPIANGSFEGELTTPTGAAILAVVVDDFKTAPFDRIEKVGYGLGDHDFKERPNALRILMGTRSMGAPRDAPTLVMIETNIDDMNPQLYGPLMETIFKKGAWDVHLIPVQMKKNRPGVLIRVLCDEAKRKTLTEIIFKETTTLGVRFFPVEREELEREFRKIKTPFGEIPVKVSRRNGKILNLVPEYEDSLRLAKKAGVSLKEIYRFAAKQL
ncbi:MAG: nickel pincer cofactor biosynthesis protein LarC [Deltaproteobacteria bacterium]|nr:nickel pincer cofactor biosynthesis protein LarC [Deltaproteobacteria bacterium]